jgi:protein-disulfide isomerase
MRCRSSALVAAILLALTPIGSTRAGVPGTALTDDGYGVQVGSADAPTRLEIFCEPQCPHCAEFEAASGEQIGRDLSSDRLAVTYRWLTFLDEKHHNDTSARVGNALMLAADPATSAVAYQGFVTQVYRQQDSHEDGPTAEDIAAMALESGVPAPVVDRIAAGEPAVDSAAMNAANRDRLNRTNPEHPGTPTVYDLNADNVVDTDDAGWLDRLTQDR